MSPKKTLLTIGLSALGLFGYTATRAAYPGDALAPTGPPSAPASSPTHTVLLKTNGDLLTGRISEDDSHYLVHKSGGTIPVPKAQVEETFESIPAVYRYKLSGVNERDPDERLKLARWFLSQNMPAEAMVELRAVVALSPGSVEPRSMLAKLEASEERARTPRVDPGLVRTGGEATMSATRGGESRPAEIDPRTIRGAQRDLGISGLPVIFDLPPAVAIKRAELFARDVHPILQTACARCHNEQYAGSFQLVEVKSRRGLSGDALRANLDATLRLIDSENPARSELLSNALVPHGNRPNPRPIFRGANDPRYQIIAAWVNSLRVTRAGDGATQTRFAPREPSGGEGFAVERAAGQVVSPVVSSTPPQGQPRMVPGLDRKEVLPSSRFVPGQGMVVERAEPPAEEFPAPFMLGGPPPKLNSGAATPPNVPAPAPVPIPATPEPLPPLPTSLPPSAETAAPAPAATTRAKAKAPLKLDPELLQRAILDRNSGR